jgi:hypothetical protein
MEMEKDLGKNGRIYVYSEFDGKFSKNLTDFLFKTMENFANVSIKFMRSDWPDFPFVYR